MKRLLLFCCLLGLHPLAQAQAVPYNVVFDVTSKDSNVHQSVIRWLTGILQEQKNAQLEVVLYGQSLDMVQTGKSSVAPALVQLMQRPNVRVAVCAAAMKRHNIAATALLPGVQVVPDGIYEIIVRQKEGWGYIKAAGQ